MATNHLSLEAWPFGSAADKPKIRMLTVQRFPYVVFSAAEVLDLIAEDAGTGAVIQNLMLFGRVYTLDALDEITPHDGVSVLVSNDNKRYKLAVGTDIVAWAVISKLSVPPGSPAIGDAYLVGAAPTGAWADQDDAVAIYTSRGWEFVLFGVGRLLYFKNVDGYYHRKSDGTWEAGLGTQVLVANSVKVSSLIGQPVRWIVENRTTFVPPASPSIGVAYIIGGGTPTGAWVGQSGNVAQWEGDAWGIYVSREGELAYDKGAKIDVRFTGSAWVSAAGSVIQAGTSGWVANPTTSSGGSGSDTWDPVTPPSLTTNYLKDDGAHVVLTAPNGKRVRMLYEFTHGSTRTQSLVLCKDDLLAPVDYIATIAYGANQQGYAWFEFTTNDNDPHTYAAAFLTRASNTANQTLSKTRLSYEVFA